MQLGIIAEWRKRRAKKRMHENVVPFSALVNLSNQLLEAGMDDRSVGFLIGKIMGDIALKAMAEAVQVLGEDRMGELGGIPDEAERLQILDQEFRQAKGISLRDYQEQLAEAVLQDFEAA